MPGEVYITGATGRLGGAVLERTGGIPLVRKPSRLKNCIVTDFSIDELKRILADASCVIHIAGSVDTLDRGKLQEANVELTRRIVDTAPAGCRIVFSGSVSVYGKTPVELPVDERTPANPDSAYARSKYMAEKIVASHPNHVILRIGTIYGPQFEDYNRVLGMIVKGRMRIIGDGSNRIPFVHVDDVADAVAAAVTKGNGVYVIASDPLTQREIYTLAAKELGVPAPTRTIRREAALVMASLGEWGYRLGGKKPTLTGEHVSVLAYDRVFDCSRARKDLGFAPRPLADGIKAMVKDYKSRSNR